MLVLIVTCSPLLACIPRRAIPETLHLAAIAVVDEGPLAAVAAHRLGDFYPPQFTQPALICAGEMDAGMDGRLTPSCSTFRPTFQRDVLAGRAPRRASERGRHAHEAKAFSGSGTSSRSVLAEVQDFARRYRASHRTLPRGRWNADALQPTLDKAWFGGADAVINYVTWCPSCSPARR